MFKYGGFYYFSNAFIYPPKIADILIDLVYYQTNKSITDTKVKILK